MCRLVVEKKYGWLVTHLQNSPETGLTNENQYAQVAFGQSGWISVDCRWISAGKSAFWAKNGRAFARPARETIIFSPKIEFLPPLAS